MKLTTTEYLAPWGEVLYSELENANLSSEYRTNLEKLILLEKAKKADHVRSAFAWGCCTVAMTAVAVVGCVTCGAGVPVAMSILAVVSGVIRKWWVNQVSHIDNVKKAMAADPSGKSLFDRLMDLSALSQIKLGNTQINLNELVTINRDQPEFFKKTTSMKEYLSNLLVKDPERAKKLITVLENGDADGSEELFKEYLDTRRFKIGDTNGIKIYEGFTAVVSH